MPNVKSKILQLQIICLDSRHLHTIYTTQEHIKGHWRLGELISQIIFLCPEIPNAKVT